MSRDKRNKLWAYMPTMAHAPPPRQTQQHAAIAPRQITEADIQPLRVDTQWRPVQVLKWFGPAQHDHEYLPRLLVACAVLQGVHRILELSERLQQLINVQFPRVLQMLRDDSLESKKEQLEELRARLELARHELTQTRARAANDIEGDPLNPDGLRVLDLDVLKSHTQMCVIGHELTSRRNVTGIEYGLGVALNIPNQRYAEDWLDRALGGAEMNGILLFTPESYRRPIVVYDDGRLAYDPLEALEGEDDLLEEPYDEDDDEGYDEGDEGYAYDDPYDEYEDGYDGDDAYEDDLY